MKNYKIKFRKKEHNFLNFYIYRYNRIFLGFLIKRGRKIWAYNFMRKLKYKLKNIEKFDPSLIFFFSLVKIAPAVLLCPYKWGGNIEGVPLPISSNKKMTFSVKWTIKLLREKWNRLILDDIAKILVEALYDKGHGYLTRMDYQKSGVKNKFLIKYYKW